MECCGVDPRDPVRRILVVNHMIDWSVLEAEFKKLGLSLKISFPLVKDSQIVKRTKTS